MKKLVAVLLAVGFAASVALISGCGQSTPTINTSNPQPAGLVLRGKVMEYNTSGAIAGPLAGASVHLSGFSAQSSAIGTTMLTNANGEYIFQSVPDGSYIITVTCEGYTRARTSNVAIKPSSYIPADNTIQVTDIGMYSNPIILSYSPVPTSVISRSQVFTVAFNEAMDTSSVVFMLAPKGVRTLVTSPFGSVPINTAWDAANKVATITPLAQLVSNEVYTLSMNNTATDPKGYIITDPSNMTRDQMMALTQDFRVATNGVPGAPGNLMIVVNSKLISSDASDASTAWVDFGDVFAGGNTVGLSWTPGTGVITGYRVYAADSATGNYALISVLLPVACTASPTISQIMTALYGVVAANFDPLGTGNWPMINNTLYLKVVAFNGDGESAAASVSAKELSGPRLNATSKRDGYGGANINGKFWLPKIDALDTKIAYIAFDEPVDVASATTIANYTIAGGNVLSATLMGNSSTTSLTDFGANTYTIIKITADVAVAGAKITVKPGTVKDLAGNVVTSGAEISITP